MAIKKRAKFKIKSQELLYQGVDWYYLIPLALLGAFVPTIVSLVVIPLPPHISEFWNSNENWDFFSYQKAQWVIILASVGFLAALFARAQSSFRFLRNPIYIPLGIYALMITMSTVMADSIYRDVALQGFPDRYEGMYVLLAYVLLTWIAHHLITKPKHLYLIAGSLLFSATIISTIGIFQFFGMDVFNTEFGKIVSIPGTYDQLRDTFQMAFGKYTIYSTLYNTNYVGGYMAIMLIIALASFFTARKWTTKIGLGIIVCLLFSNWIGSNSRAGLLGGLVGLFMFGLLAYRVIRTKWKSTSVLTICLVLIAFSLNHTSDGRLLDKYKQLISMPSLVNVAMADSQTDRPKVVKLQNIHLDGQNVFLDMQDQTLTLKLTAVHENLQYGSEDVAFYDTQSSPLETTYNEETNVVHFTDELYQSYSIIIRDNHFEIRYGRLHIDLAVGSDGKFYFVSKDGYLVSPVVAPSIGFEGKERIGSGRGYIWSRTFPMLKDTLFIGHGPDTFAMYFPQHDFVAKYKYLKSFYSIVDKPHNMYLQIGVNTGGISLLAFVGALTVYVISSLRLYVRAISVRQDMFYIFGIGILSAVVAYSVAGIFNDSAVSVAPAFWLLLGAGLACNERIKNTLHISESSS